ncbi:MAG: transcription termination/antitermination protein NusG [Beijerinckiaceae bacterium]|jgi:transcription elongation factor/antiterminator RfaH
MQAFAVRVSVDRRALAPVASLHRRWHVVRTLPNRERGACAQLEAQGFETFLPLVARTVRHARKLRVARAPLFPSYAFVAFDPSQERWRSVNGTFGVSRLVMAGDAPAPAPRGVVEALLAARDASGCVRLDADLAPGQKVEIIAGPFARAIGSLARLDGQGRVTVLLDIMGGRVPAALDRSALRAV